VEFVIRWPSLTEEDGNKITR